MSDKPLRISKGKVSEPRTHIVAVKGYTFTAPDLGHIESYLDMACKYEDPKNPAYKERFNTYIYNLGFSLSGYGALNLIFTLINIFFTNFSIPEAPIFLSIPAFIIGLTMILLFYWFESSKRKIREDFVNKAIFLIDKIKTEQEKNKE